MHRLFSRRWIGRLAVASAAAGAAACSFGPSRYAGADAPRALPLNRSFARALVLSTGGPRGFVHVGVLKALDELKWRPDLIVGASVGALVGVLYAGGYSAAELEALAMDLPVTVFGALNLVGDGRFSGAPLAAFVNERLAQRTGSVLLEKLRIPVTVVAASQAERSVIGFTHGEAGAAVQASTAIEGHFSPVEIKGQRYIDADLVAPLPVRLARSLGAQRVLAIDASARENEAPPGAERYRAGDLRKRALTLPDAQLADLSLQPRMDYYVSLSKAFRERTIEAGYRDTLAAAARILAL